MENKKHLLIIEDSPDLQMLLQQLFKREGYLISQAFNGQEALDLLNKMSEPPALIFLDLMMPVMDGFVFRHEQQKDPRISKIPVVVMSADSHPEVKAESLHASGYVRKPLDMKKLIEIAARLSA